MEDSHPAELTAADAAGELLVRGLDDWVSLDEARWLVGVHENGDAAALRDATLAVISELVERGLVRLGDLHPRFAAWSSPPDDALRRVRREWWDPNKELRPGDVCWIENTPAGDEIARSIEAARDV